MGPMPPPDQMPLVDRILEGGLFDFLESRRSTGKSFDSIARDLLVEHQVDVSDAVVARWCRRYEIPDPIRSDAEATS